MPKCEVILERALRSIPAIAIVTILLGVPQGVAFQTEPRWIGTWEQDLSASTDRSIPSPYKRVTFTIEPLGEGLKVAYDMVGTRGGRTHIEWAGAFDGTDYAVQGVDYVLTNAYSSIDDQTYRIVVKFDGQVAATTEVSVSTDGQVLTAVTTETGPEGQSITSTAVYVRR